MGGKRHGCKEEDTGRWYKQQLAQEGKRGRENLHEKKKRKQLNTRERSHHLTEREINDCRG